MASRRKLTNKRAAPKKPKRKRSTVKVVVGKPKRKASPGRGAMRKPKRKTSAVKGVVPQPNQPYPMQAVAKGPKINLDTVRPVVIEPRRQVETSDALLFPSGRPIRKR